MLRYLEAFPADLEAAWAVGAPAILPLGALEWHGKHLPLGTDTLLVDSFAVDLAARVNGVLLPCLNTPMTTLPHRHSLQVRPEAFRMIIEDTVGGLIGSGAKTIVLLTGHYAQGQLWELFEIAFATMKSRPEMRVFAGTPLQALGNPNLLDHAGSSETSQLLHTCPDLVRLFELPEEPSSTRDAVLGEDPRSGSVAVGAELVSSALDAWVEWIRFSPLESMQTWQNELQGYRAAYFKGNWDEAIQTWWESK